jgi:hypothetical protein
MSGITLGAAFLIAVYVAYGISNSVVLRWLLPGLFRHR